MSNIRFDASNARTYMKSYVYATTFLAISPKVCYFFLRVLKFSNNAAERITRNAVVFSQLINTYTIDK